MKITKTKVLTVLLIIAVVIIAILSVKLLSKEENNIVNQPQDVVVNNEQVEEKKEEPAVEEKKIKGEKLIQFDTEFYNLEDVALEWRDSEKVKNYKDFNYDLDGDGVVDKVTMKQTEDGLSLSLNGEVFAETGFRTWVYIVDLNEDDKDIEVVTYDDGPSDDPNYTIYSKNNGKIERYNRAGWIDKVDKKGKILVEDDIIIEPRIYFSYLFIKNGRIEEKSIENIDNIKELEVKIYSNGPGIMGFSEDRGNFEKYWTYDDAYSDMGACAERCNIDFIDVESDVSFKIIDGLYVQHSDGRKGYLQFMQFAD